MTTQEIKLKPNCIHPEEIEETNFEKIDLLSEYLLNCKQPKIKRYTVEYQHPVSNKYTYVYFYKRSDADGFVKLVNRLGGDAIKITIESIPFQR